jgi:hypothetical protein
MEKGDSNRELFVVEHGKAIGTDANIVTTYVPGDFFGELEFIGIGDVSNAHMCVCVFVCACVRACVRSFVNCQFLIVVAPAD